MEARETFACARAAEFSRPLGTVKSIAWPFGIHATLGTPPAATGFGKRTPVLTAEGVMAAVWSAAAIRSDRFLYRHTEVATNMSGVWNEAPGAYSIGTDTGLTGMGNSASTRFSGSFARDRRERFWLAARARRFADRSCHRAGRDGRRGSPTIEGSRSRPFGNRSAGGGGWRRLTGAGSRHAPSVSRTTGGSRHRTGIARAPFVGSAGCRGTGWSPRGEGPWLLPPP